MMGRTARSRPTIAPTNAFTATSSVSCCQLSLSPSWSASERFNAARLPVRDDHVTNRHAELFSGRDVIIGDSTGSITAHAPLPPQPAM
jgi:hypothetical protein